MSDAAKAEAIQWFPTLEFRWLKVPGTKRGEQQLQQLWRRAGLGNNREWRTVETVFEE